MLIDVFGENRCRPLPITKRRQDGEAEPVERATGIGPELWKIAGC